MSQKEKLYNLLKDGQPHRTDQIVTQVYGQGMSLARVGARVYDIKKSYGVEIYGWKDKSNPALYWYSLKPQKIETVGHITYAMAYDPKYCCGDRLDGKTTHSKDCKTLAPKEDVKLKTLF